MLRTTELFINELKERALNYKEVRTLQDGDDLVRLGFDLENTQVEMLILLTHPEKLFPSDVLMWHV